MEDVMNVKEKNMFQEYVNRYIILDKFRVGEYKEADCCYYTWENLFKKYFSNRKFWENTNFEEFIIYNKRKTIKYNGMEFLLSGDILFNFSSKEDGKKMPKYDRFYNLLLNDPYFTKIERCIYLDMLRFCNEMTYTLHNVGFMPVTGSLQTFKGNLGGNLDRIDSFIYWLDNYYIDGTNKDIFIDRVKLGKNNYSEEEKKIKLNSIRNALRVFLGEFSNGIDKDKAIYKYCQEMYLIFDEEIVRRLVDSGKEEINDGKAVVRYMKLAIEYWIMKDKIFSRDHLLEEGGVQSKEFFCK